MFNTLNLKLMKMKSILISCAALAMVFASCSKSDEVGSDGSFDVAVKIPSELLANGGTRGIIESPEAGGTGVKTTIDNIQYFLLNNNSVVEQHYYTAAPVGTEYFRNVSAAINKVIVIANVPASDLTAVQALTTEAAIQAYAYSLATQQPSATAITSPYGTAPGIAQKTMICETTTFVTQGTNPIAGSSNTYKLANVTLKSVTARIEVGAVKEGTGIVANSLELVGVWINNYYTDGSKASVQFNNDAATVWSVPNAGTVSSTAITPGAVPAYTAPDLYLAANNSLVTLNAASRAYVFHVFADAAEAVLPTDVDAMPHLILLVKGEYATGYYENNDKYFLKWVTFRRYIDDATSGYLASMDRNQIYKIGTGATGITINAKDLTEKPEMNEVDLGVAVTVAAWNPNTLTPEAL